jgi:hypothetical protein
MAWHTHPLGQTLTVTYGSGSVQREKGAIEEIRAGEIVWFPPGEKHWHGASPTMAMTHFAIQESQGARNADWLEHVTDAQYAGSGKEDDATREEIIEVITHLAFYSGPAIPAGPQPAPPSASYARCSRKPKPRKEPANANAQSRK